MLECMHVCMPTTPHTHTHLKVPIVSDARLDLIYPDLDVPLAPLPPVVTCSSSSTSTAQQRETNSSAHPCCVSPPAAGAVRVGWQGGLEHVPTSLVDVSRLERVASSEPRILVHAVCCCRMLPAAQIIHVCVLGGPSSTDTGVIMP